MREKISAVCLAYAVISEVILNAAIGARESYLPGNIVLPRQLASAARSKEDQQLCTAFSVDLCSATSKLLMVGCDKSQTCRKIENWDES